MKYIIMKCPKHCVNVPQQSGRTYWGGLEAGINPVIHYSLSDAKTEAGRLAKNFPNDVFIVFQAITSASVVTPVSFTDFK